MPVALFVVIEWKQKIEDKVAEKVRNMGEWWQTSCALKSSQEPVLAFGLLS